MQGERWPDYPLLYSVQGFQYCDLLLAEAERAAWQLLLNPKSEVRNPKLVQACRAVEQRAVQTIKIAERNNWLLDIALDHLTLGRAALYWAILEHSSLDTCHSSLDQAVAALRRAAQQQYLPLGLLTRAWLRFLTGVRTGRESAQSDLDDAWDIAERGPMPLFIADIHLYRARLFGMLNADCGLRNEEAAYPWTSPEHDLREARRLIEKHGYWRRKEELEDAEQAFKLGKPAAG